MKTCLLLVNGSSLLALWIDGDLSLGKIHSYTPMGQANTGSLMFCTHLKIANPTKIYPQSDGISIVKLSAW